MCIYIYMCMQCMIHYVSVYTFVANKNDKLRIRMELYFITDYNFRTPA